MHSATAPSRLEVRPRPASVNAKQPAVIMYWAVLERMKFRNLSTAKNASCQNLVLNRRATGLRSCALLLVGRDRTSAGVCVMVPMCAARQGALTKVSEVYELAFGTATLRFRVEHRERSTLAISVGPPEALLLRRPSCPTLIRSARWCASVAAGFWNSRRTLHISGHGRRQGGTCPESHTSTWGEVTG